MNRRFWRVYLEWVCGRMNRGELKKFLEESEVEKCILIVQAIFTGGRSVCEGRKKGGG